MSDRTWLDELVERYRSARDSAVSPYLTAVSVVAPAWDRLDDGTKSTLIVKGSRNLRYAGLPPEARLSGSLTAKIRSSSGYIRYARVGAGTDDEQEVIDYIDFLDSDDSEQITVVASDLVALASAALPEIEQDRVEAKRRLDEQKRIEHLRVDEQDRIEGIRVDVAAGRLDVHALTDDDYVKAYGTDAGTYAWFGCAGWFLGVLVSVIAGIVVALIKGDALLFAPIALGGVILGFIATFGLAGLYEGIDVELRHRSESITAVIYVFAGSAVALLVAIIVLANA